MSLLEGYYVSFHLTSFTFNEENITNKYNESTSDARGILNILNFVQMESVLQNCDDNYTYTRSQGAPGMDF